MCDPILLRGGSVFTEAGIFETKNVLISQGKILALLTPEESAPDAEIIDCSGKLITPGFIDIHIHGRDGFDVENAPEQVAQVLPKYGVTAFLPTTLTRSFEETLQTMGSLSDYIDTQSREGAQALGIYSEGMYFSREKAGAQNPEYLRDEVPISELEQLIAASRGHLKVIAFAPEKTNAPAAAAYLKAKGIRSSMAHTNALYSDVMACIEQGLDGVTHVYDGMRGMTHIELGAAGAATFVDSLSCELIADGYHVNPEFINILFRFKPLDKIIFISDNVPPSGTAPGKCELGGLPVINEGDRLVLDTNNGVFSLAGSCLRLCDSIRNVHHFTGLPIEKLIPCATVNPAKYIGVYDRKGSIREGKDADLNIFDQDLDLCATYIHGQIYNKGE